MRGTIIDTLLVAGLLVRAFYPEFLQAHYFESSACVFMLFLSLCCLIGMLVINDNKRKYKSFFEKRSDFSKMFFDFRKMVVLLAAIYSSHYVIGILFWTSVMSLDSLRDSEVKK